MDRNELIEIWKHEEQHPFSGWDFSYLRGRMIEEECPWSYSSRAAELMRHSSSVVDMGTGGGEKLLELREYWPAKVVATEEYPPNFKLATERLSPFGARVIHVRLAEEGPMPFRNEEFDLVLNRHSAFNSNEVTRILSAGGTFLTQQVHGLWAQDLLAAFNAKPPWPEATPERYVPRMTSAGLTVEDLREWSGKLVFSDVGAIVYYLKAVPWLVPGFSVETHQDCLLELQNQIEAGEPLTYTARLYLIEARKYQPQ
jgi:SAM-dependent methyltransferase